MDPLTHALAGAATARVALAKPLGRAAWLPGAAAALLPDADAFIRSGADPLLYAEFHRNFTHALAFIPAGGAIAAAPWLAARERRRSWPAYLAAATAGYATHGVLDASTTYGTLLYWPFSPERVAWNVISIVDPLFTLVLLTGVLLAIRAGTARPAALALAVGLAYLGVGAVQRDRAQEAQAQLAAARGHEIARGAVFPSFATNIIWRSLYEAGDTLYMDRLRVPWFGAPAWREGTTAAPLREEELPTAVRHDSRLVRDFRRFRRFSNGWVARAPDAPDVVGDARYSMSTARFEPVWGVRLTPGGTEAAVEWVDGTRTRRIDVRELWAELAGLDPKYRPMQGADE